MDKPICVDGFRDQLIGVNDNTIGTQRTVPMAGTLGLGYVLNLSQVWRYDGLALHPAYAGHAARSALGGQTMDSAEAAGLDTLNSATNLARQAMNAELKGFEIEKQGTSKKREKGIKALRDQAQGLLAETAVQDRYLDWVAFAKAKIKEIAGEEKLSAVEVASLVEAYDKKWKGSGPRPAKHG